MPTPPFPASQPQAQNKCPDCVYVKLTGRFKLSPATQIELYLTINFNEQWENIIGGRVKFGLKGGELRLKLKNGTIPYESRELTGSLELSLQKKRVEQEGNKAQTEIEAVFSDVVATPAAGVKTKMKTEQTQGKTDEIHFFVCQVTTKGDEEKPAWAFAVETGQLVLKGLLKQALLGTVNVKAKPCWIEATLEVSKRDIYITDAEGLWPPDISRNKRAVLERLIAWRLLESRFQPYLSRVELRYE